MPPTSESVFGSLCSFFVAEFANRGVPVYDSTVRYVPRFDHATIYHDIMNVWHRLLLIGIASCIHSHMMMEFLGGFVITQALKASS